MPELMSLLIFAGAGAVMTITPGPDSLLVFRTSAAAGTWQACAASMGICLGLLIWALGAALGLTSVLATSKDLYLALQWIGAVYLFWVGYRLLTCQNSNIYSSDLPAQKPPENAWFTAGLFTNLSNPKIGIFYVSFLPQFVPADAQVGSFMVIFASIHILEGAIWFALIIFLTQRMAQWLRKTSLLSVIDRLAGTVFVGFGLRLIL